MTLIKSISGIRGTIGGRTGDTLNPLDIVKFTTAYATFIRRSGKSRNNKIVVGRDGRISGPMVRNVVVGTLMGMGYDVIDIDGGRVWDLDKSREITRIIKPEEIQDLAGIVKSEIGNADIYRDKIRKIKNEEIYNFGHAGEAAAKQLVEMLKK